MDDLISWLIGQIGCPRPCDLCRTPTESRLLREVWVPNPVPMTGAGWISPQRCQWVCPTCPG